MHRRTILHEPSQQRRSLSQQLRAALPTLAIAGAFLVSRFIHLDADAPIFDKTEYTAIDEFFYATKALFWSRQPLYDQFTGIANHFPFSWLSNVATFVALELLGQNFFGLRASAVLAGLTIVILTYRLAADRFGHLYGIFCALYLLVDYHFMLASRIVEPTIYRMVALFISLILFKVYLRTAAASPNGEAGGWLRMLLSAVIVALYLLEYPTNYFLIVAWVLMLFFAERMTVLGVLRRVGQFVIAALIAGNLYLLLLVWQGLYTDSPLRFINRFTDRLVPTFEGIYTNYLNVLHTQFLLHGPALRWIFPLAGLIFGVMAFARWVVPRLRRRPVSADRHFDLVLALILAGAVGQHVLDASYALRKPILLLPLLLLALCYCVHALAQVLHGVRGQRIAAIVLALVLGYSAIIHAPLIWTNFYANPKFTHRDASIAMKKYDGYYFVGGYAWVYSSYNNILPIGNPYLLTIPELGPSVPALSSMYYAGRPDEPALTVLETEAYRGLVKETFEPVEFLICSLEQRYYPAYVFKRRGVALTDAIASSKVPHGPLDAPLAVSQRMEDCPFHPEPPSP